MTDIKRIYRQLRDGDKTKIALRRRKSSQYISRLTSIGGDDCPALKYIRWYADVLPVNRTVADQMHEYVNEMVREAGNDESNGEFEAPAAACEILDKTSDVVRHLLDGKISASDEEALLRLAAVVERTLAQIRESQAVDAVMRPIRLEGVQPSSAPFKRVGRR